MKIESLLRRPGGTKVSLGGVEYHFKPAPDGREFADVTNMDHVGIFASIREGYRVAGAESSQTETAKPAAPEPRPAYIDGETEPYKDNLEKMDRVALADLFTKRFGRPPASTLGKNKLIEALREG